MKNADGETITTTTARLEDGRTVEVTINVAESGRARVSYNDARSGYVVESSRGPEWVTAFVRARFARDAREAVLAAVEAAVKSAKETS